MKLLNHPKYIVFSILFLLSFVAYSQTIKYNKVDILNSKHFIKKVINQYAYNNPHNGIRNNYNVSIGDSIMIICNDKGTSGSQNIFTKFYITDIDSILIVEKKYNIWLTLKLRPDKKEFAIYNNKILTPLGKHELILDKSFGKDSLPYQLQNAFLTLMNRQNK